MTYKASRRPLHLHYRRPAVGLSTMKYKAVNAMLECATAHAEVASRAHDVRLDYQRGQSTTIYSYRCNHVCSRRGYPTTPTSDFEHPDISRVPVSPREIAFHRHGRHRDTRWTSVVVWTANSRDCRDVNAMIKERDLCQIYICV